MCSPPLIQLLPTNDTIRTGCKPYHKTKTRVSEEQGNLTLILGGGHTPAPLPPDSKGFVVEMPNERR